MLSKLRPVPTISQPRRSWPVSFSGYQSFKFYYIHQILLVALCVLFLFEPQTVQAAPPPTNPKSCITNFQNGNDYFAVKSGPIMGGKFSVTYNSTFKVVQNQVTGRSFVLYLCGTPQPNVTSVPISNYIQIPVTSVAVDSTVQIPFIEMLGARSTITVEAAGAQYISSPCVLQQLANGTTIDMPYKNYTSLTTQGVQVYFNSGFSNDTAVSLAGPVPVHMNTADNTPLAILDWLTYVSFFYNAEDIANAVVTNARTRYACNSAYALSLTANKPRVMWAYYSSYANGWSVGTLNNYYVSFIQDAGGVFVTFPSGSISMYGTTFLTHSEFAAVASTVDVWLYPSTWDSTVNQTVVANFKSVRNQAVFDVQGSGPGTGDWFENRLLEPTVVLKDIITTMYPTAMTNYTRVFFRNVFTDPIGPPFSAANCTDPLGTQLYAPHELFNPTCIYTPLSTTASATTTAAMGTGAATTRAVTTAAASGGGATTKASQSFNGATSISFSSIFLFASLLIAAVSGEYLF